MKHFAYALCVAAAVSGCASDSSFIPRSGPLAEQLQNSVPGVNLVRLDLQESKRLASVVGENKAHTTRSFH